jgi:hypothetical protein
MTRRVLILVVSIVGLLGLTLSADRPFSADWTAALTLDPDGTFLSGLESAVDLSYETGPVLWTSYSNFQLTVGYLWQEFGVTGHLGAFEIQGDLLFGPSTSDYLYLQLMASLDLAGCEVAAYFAQVSEAVVGGPADGFAIRLSGSIGGLDITSITELGARVRDEDYGGITIVHAASGLYRTYDTNPLVPGQGFTGERITLSGLECRCADETKGSLYFTCSGFGSLTLMVEGIETNLPWLSLDAELVFQIQTKSLVLVPRLTVGQIACLHVYADLVTGGGGNAPIEGISVYGLELSCKIGSATFRDLSVLDPSRYAITTPAYGSVIERIADAIDAGHEYYPDYWEMLSLDIPIGGCCGGTSSVTIYTYFSQGSSSLFAWAMTSAEARIAFSDKLEFRGGMEISAAGTKLLHFGVRYEW